MRDYFFDPPGPFAPTERLRSFLRRAAKYPPEKLADPVVRNAIQRAKRAVAWERRGKWKRSPKS